MAPDSRPHYSPRMNSLMNSTDNNLAGDPPEAPTESSGSPTFIFQAFSCNLTLTPALGLAPALVPAPAPAIGRYIDKNLQIATKLALELFLQGQKHAQL